MCDRKTLAVWLSGMFFFDGLLALFVILGWAQITLGSWAISASDGLIVFVVDMVIAFVLLKYGYKTVKSVKKKRR